MNIRPEQPVDSVRITIRKGDRLLPAIVLPMNMLQVIPAVIQAELFKDDAPGLIDIELKGGDSDGKE